MPDKAARDTNSSGKRKATGQRLPRAERREQILGAATTAFAQHGGFADTGLDDVLDAAGVTRMILYRHFDSKEELYRAVLDHATTRLHAATTSEGELTEHTWEALIDWARSNPDTFRLLFHHAVREPNFRDHVDEVWDGMRLAIQDLLCAGGTADQRTQWAARLATAVAIEGILAWFDAGRPDPEQLSSRLRNAVEAATAQILS
ncbi:TetR family transcriptional regulator [Tamaricihabitans halophyticus]|uniref:TetR family transcriptional regulator n=1 Tax=Tamaricihabitans halophyticus TaxID=1262583 RepID=A0A4R2R3K0_9PSEU|nr:TetR/AcrR family transcriptional regulator [Tamaricihabitans halophyticus]TCP56198.1 TetR family transcriptional regulator [Tamaricihabitans halophyticus]